MTKLTFLAGNNYPDLPHLQGCMKFGTQISPPLNFSLNSVLICLCNIFELYFRRQLKCGVGWEDSWSNGLHVGLVPERSKVKTLPLPFVLSFGKRNFIITDAASTLLALFMRV